MNRYWLNFSTSLFVKRNIIVKNDYLSYKTASLYKISGHCYLPLLKTDLRGETFYIFSHSLFSSFISACFSIKRQTLFFLSVLISRRLPSHCHPSHLPHHFSRTIYEPANDFEYTITVSILNRPIALQSSTLDSSAC